MHVWVSSSHIPILLSFHTEVSATESTDWFLTLKTKSQQVMRAWNVSNMYRCEKLHKTSKMA